MCASCTRLTCPRISLTSLVPDGKDAGEQIPLRYSRSQALPAIKSRLSFAALGGDLLFRLAVLTCRLRLLGLATPLGGLEDIKLRSERRRLLLQSVQLVTRRRDCGFGRIGNLHLREAPLRSPKLFDGRSAATIGVLPFGCGAFELLVGGLDRCVRLGKRLFRPAQLFLECRNERPVRFELRWCVVPAQCLRVARNEFHGLDCGIQPVALIRESTQLGFENRDLRLRKRRSPQHVELVLDHPGGFTATLNLSLRRLGGIVVPLERRLAVARGLEDRATQLNRADRVAPQYVAQAGGPPPEIGSSRRGGSLVALGPPRADDESLLAPVPGRRPATRPDLQAALRHPPPGARAGVGPLVCSRSEHPAHQPQHAAPRHASRAPSDRGEDESGSA